MYRLKSWTELNNMDALIHKLVIINKEKWGIIKILPPTNTIWDYKALPTCESINQFHIYKIILMINF
jgi:hypothetical protein